MCAVKKCIVPVGASPAPAFDQTQAKSGMRKTPDTSRLSRQPEGRFQAVLAVPAVFEFLL